MYYDLTKKEYKEFESSFNKTYIGKKLYLEVMLSMFTGLILFGIAGFDIGYRSVEVFEITLFNIALLLVGGFALIESSLKEMKHREELKQYIIEKSKK